MRWGGEKRGGVEEGRGGRGEMRGGGEEGRGGGKKRDRNRGRKQKKRKRWIQKNPREKEIARQICKSGFALQKCVYVTPVKPAGLS